MQPASFYHMLSVIYLLIIARTIVLVQIDFLFQFVLSHDMLLFTPFSVTRFAMHRIYANRINSRGISRVFCDLRSQKTPRGILPVNSNAYGHYTINYLLLAYKSSIIKYIMK